METIIQGAKTGLYFAWNQSRTVNVRHTADGPDVECFSLDYNKPATYKRFLADVEDWESGQ